MTGDPATYRPSPQHCQMCEFSSPCLALIGGNRRRDNSWRKFFAVTDRGLGQTKTGTVDVGLWQRGPRRLSGEHRPRRELRLRRAITSGSRLAKNVINLNCRMWTEAMPCRGRNRRP